MGCASSGVPVAPAAAEPQNHRPGPPVKEAFAAEASGLEAAGGASGSNRSPAQHGWRGQVAGAFAKQDSAAWNEFVDSRLGARVIGSSVVINASKTAVVSLLNEACDEGDAAKIKGALLAAQRLGVTEVPEFKRAAERYRGLRVLPEHWDTSKMMRGRQGRRLVAKTCVTDANVLTFFQTLLDRTFRKVLTRDRRDGEAPDRLELASAIDVANEDLWTVYVARRKAIVLELEASTEETLEVQPKTTVVLSSQTGPSLNLLAPALEQRANEAFLFHGTRGVAAEKITTMDFALDRCGTNAGTLYGRGIYFAENSSKSDEYSAPDGEDEIRTLLLCRVTLGRPFYTNELKPDGRQCQAHCQNGPFHSVLGDRRACSRTFREFVIFDEGQAYPNYIIRYRRRHGTVVEAT